MMPVYGVLVWLFVACKWHFWGVQYKGKMQIAEQGRLSEQQVAVVPKCQCSYKGHAS